MSERQLMTHADIKEFTDRVNKLSKSLKKATFKVAEFGRNLNTISGRILKIKEEQKIKKGVHKRYTKVPTIQ